MPSQTPASNPPPQQLVSQKRPWRCTATPAFQRGSSIVVSGAPNGLHRKMHTQYKHVMYVHSHTNELYVLVGSRYNMEIN